MLQLKSFFARLIGICLLVVICGLGATAQKDTTDFKKDTSAIKKYKVDPGKKRSDNTQTISSSSAMFVPPPPGGCILLGNSSVTAGTTYAYSLSCDDASIADYWGVICGTGINYYSDGIDVVWDGSCSSGTVSAYAPDGSLLASKTVSINVAPLNGGSVSPASQSIGYNTVPAQLIAGEATGSTCVGDEYGYQWQKSTDNINFTNISGATGWYYQPGPLTVTTYFRRKVSCSSSIAYTNTAVITVTAQLIGGTITSSNQTVNYNTPTLITASVATGGNCAGNYQYQWQQSVDNINFSNISGASSQNYQPAPVSVTTYYKRKVTCNGETAFTNNIDTITVIHALNAGCIISGDQTVVNGNIPATITTLPASYGSCNGNYSYQWQSSYDNNYFTDVPGATAQNLGFSSTLPRSTYFQRRATCGSEVQYTESIIINMVAYITYYNTVTSDTFTRNNCATGGTGSSVTYAVAANTYTSIISQSDANAKAQNDVNVNGQAYANANGYCTWYNISKSGNFTKSNCANGGIGSTVTYTVSPGIYSSTINQADADQKAQNDVNVNGQTYANANGYCTWYNISKSGNFTKSNCANGGIGSTVTYTVSQGIYSSTISQADADQKAQNDVNINGQTYANANGYCTWYNISKSGNFTKSNCANGGIGSSVTYTVSPGIYSSTISQADADQKAQNDVNANGPSFANSNGYCTWYNDAISGYYFSQNCTGGATALAYYVSVPANNYSSTLSKLDANNQAQAYAQQQANLYGDCTNPNFTLTYNNSLDLDFYIELTDVNTNITYNFYNLYAGSFGDIGDIPPGTYDIHVYHTAQFSDTFIFVAGCGYYTYGNEGYWYSIELNENCAQIQLSY